MKLSNRMFAKLENVGRPKDLRIVEGDMGTLIKEMAKWILELHMGSEIRVRFATNRTQLERQPRNMGVRELESVLENELDDLLAGLPEDIIESN